MHPAPICRCSSKLLTKEWHDFLPVSFSLPCRAPTGAQRSPGHPPTPALHSKGDDASSLNHPQCLEAAGLQEVATSNNFASKQTSGSDSGQMGWSCQQNLGTQSLGEKSVLHEGHQLGHPKDKCLELPATRNVTSGRAEAEWGLMVGKPKNKERERHIIPNTHTEA